MADGSDKPENADREILQRMLDDTLWNLGIGAASGLIAGFVLLPRGASGARAVLTGLGGGFGAGRVFERYNSALEDLQIGGTGIIPDSDMTFASLKAKASSIVDQVRGAVGAGPAKEEPAEKEGSNDERS